MNDQKLFIFDMEGVITGIAEFRYSAWKDLSNDIGITY